MKNQLLKGLAIGLGIVGLDLIVYVPKENDLPPII